MNPVRCWTQNPVVQVRLNIKMLNRLIVIEKWFWSMAEKGGILFILFFMGIIYYLSTIPGIEDEKSFSNILYLWIAPDVQKLGHVAIYAFLAILWCINLNKKKLKTSINIILVLIITILFGVFGEWSQLYIPGRYASLSDCVLNSVGAVIGLLYYSKRLESSVMYESSN